MCVCVGVGVWGGDGDGGGVGWGVCVFGPRNRMKTNVFRQFVNFKI